MFTSKGGKVRPKYAHDGPVASVKQVIKCWLIFKIFTASLISELIYFSIKYGTDWFSLVMP